MSVDLYDARGGLVGTYDLDDDGTVSLGGAITSGNVVVSTMSSKPKKVTLTVTYEDGKLTITLKIE